MAEALELAKAYYAAARAEVVQRVALREQVLLAGVTAFGVLTGLSLGNATAKPELLPLFPALSFAFTLLFFRHQYIMGTMGRYIIGEIGPSLKPPHAAGATKEKWPVHWDEWILVGQGPHSKAPKRRLRVILSTEMFGACLLLWGPGLGAYCLEFGHASRAILWTDGALLAIAILPYLQVVTYILFRWRTARKVMLPRKPE